MKTVLITGGAGYIGAHTAYVLAQQGYSVILLDVFAHQQMFNKSWATIIRGDYGDQALLQSIFKNYAIDAVIHSAAFIEVGASMKNPLLYYENNVCKTVQLLHSMLAANIKTLIFSSSAAVYGIPEQLPITESHPKNPINPYGATKLMVERILEDLNQAHGLNYICLRYFNVAGTLPGTQLYEQHTPETHLIPLLIKAAVEQQSFKVFGHDHPTPDGTCVRDYVHVADIAQAHYQSLRYLDAGNPSASFNLGTGNGFSVAQIVHEVERVTGRSMQTTYAARRAGDPAFLVADPTKAKRALDWSPTHSTLENIIKTAYQGWQEQHNISAPHKIAKQITYLP